ncbi:hypothetical protein N566_05360 [Streptomycetaceae bacterium MP113-05]|nr:hypothetical protein N566_05360 [Streptomycetaceae bacterium MP113-05]
MSMNSETPTPGSYAVDVRTGILGEVMGHEGPYVQLRPLSGGREWDVPPESLRTAGTLEELSAKVNEFNRTRRLLP